MLLTARKKRKTTQAVKTLPASIKGKRLPKAKGYNIPFTKRNKKEVKGDQEGEYSNVTLPTCFGIDRIQVCALYAWGAGTIEQVEQPNELAEGRIWSSVDFLLAGLCAQGVRKECSSRRPSLDCGAELPFPDGRGVILDNRCLIKVALLSAFQ
eukprot:1155376-Pelagomonas_calceolata.AAC.1